MMRTTNTHMISPAKTTEAIIVRVMRIVARALAAGRLRTIAHGLEHVPPAGPALIVARHYHHLFDGLALFASLPRPFHVLVSLDWVKTRLTRWAMTQLTSLARWPVVLRSDGLTRTASGGRTALFSAADGMRYRRQGLRDSVQLLIEGRLLVIFPEGYPNIDPTYTPKRDLAEFLPFKAGFVTIARATEKRLRKPLAILPMGLRYKANGVCLAELHFGKPVWRKDFRSAEELVEYIEMKVKQLSG
jgi:putative membrane protein